MYSVKTSSVIYIFIYLLSILIIKCEKFEYVKYREPI